MGPRALLLLCVLATPAGAAPPPIRAPACGSLELAAMPAIPARPSSKASLAVSRRLEAPIRDERFYFDARFVDPDDEHQSRTDWQVRRAVLVADAAVRAAPSNLRAWETFVNELERHHAELHELCTAEAALAHDREALRAAYVQALEALRDATWRGCGPCAELLASQRGEALPDELTRVLASAAGGPATPIGRAARTFAEGQRPDASDAAVAAARRLVAAGASVRVNRHRVRGPAALARRLEKESVVGYGYPGKLQVMWCDARCCHFPFIDRAPLEHSMTELCFDASRHLVSVATRVTGP